MIAAGVVLTADDASAVVGALDEFVRVLAERRDQNGNPTPSRPSARLRMLMDQLRRAAAKTGDSSASEPTARLPEDRIPNASPNARDVALQPNSAHSSECATLTSGEAATLLGCSQNNVRDLRRRGALRAERIGGRWHFRAADVAERAAKGR